MRAKRTLPKQDAMLISRYEPDSPISEAYRSIRTSLKFASLDKNHKVCVFTSAIAGEGKSSIVSNLGILTAQDQNRVLIIDGDLRRPHLHHIFRLSNRSGLSTVLSGYDAVANAVLATDIPNLSILPAGPVKPNPAELLGSSRLEHILHECGELFDFVFIDTPPLLPVADGKILCRWADGIVFIVRSQFTKKEQIKKAQQVLEPHKDKMIGVIMNDRSEGS